jgi:hypothetical protein
MKSVNKTKEELMNEIEALWKKVSELERQERYSIDTGGGYIESIDRSFPQTLQKDDAIFVVFDRRLKFVNERFAELFGITPEEASNPEFDPMTLITSESRCSIREKYKEAYRTGYAMRGFDLIGLTRNGLQIACETLLTFLPIKWGMAIYGTLRNVSMSRRIDEVLQKHHKDLRFVFDAIPTEVLYTEINHGVVTTNSATRH